MPGSDELPSASHLGRMNNRGSPQHDLLVTAGSSSAMEDHVNNRGCSQHDLLVTAGSSSAMEDHVNNRGCSQHDLLVTAGSSSAMEDHVNNRRSPQHDLLVTTGSSSAMEDHVNNRGSPQHDLLVTAGSSSAMEDHVNNRGSPQHDLLVTAGSSSAMEDHVNNSGSPQHDLLVTASSSSAMEDHVNNRGCSQHDLLVTAGSSSAMEDHVNNRGSPQHDLVVTAGSSSAMEDHVNNRGSPQHDLVVTAGSSSAMEDHVNNRGSPQHDLVVTADRSSAMEDNTCRAATFSQTPLNNDSNSCYVGNLSELPAALPETEPAQKPDSHQDKDTSLAEKNEINRDLLPKSDTSNSPDAIVKHVSLFESQIPQTVSRGTNSNTFIKLMRVKSSSEEHILDVHSSSDTPTSGPEVKSTGDRYNPEMVRKRGWYFQRVRKLFRPRSSSLGGWSPNNEITPSRSHLKKAKSQTFISPNDITIVITETLAENHIQVENTDFTKEHRPRCDSGNTVQTVPAKSSQAFDNCGDFVADTNTETTLLKVHKPERSYSLIRPESEDNASTHVNFTRIPSLRIRKVQLSLAYHFTTTLPEDEIGGCQVIKEATNIQALKNGGTIVTDVLSSNIVLFDSQGCPKITFSVESGCEPWATCLTPDGGLAVTLKRQGCVSLWSTSGEPIAEFGNTVLSGPAGIQCDQQGRLVVADEQLNSVCIFNIYGELITKLHVPDAKKDSPAAAPRPKGKLKASFLTTTPCFNRPRYVCITNNGDYIIADSANHCIKIFDHDMNYKSQFGEYGKGDGQFRFPYGIASDNEDCLYVADHFNNRVSLFSPDGKFVEHLLTDQDGIARPKSLAVRYPFLYITHGYIRSSKISAFRLRTNQHSSSAVG